MFKFIKRIVKRVFVNEKTSIAYFASNKKYDGKLWVSKQVLLCFDKKSDKSKRFAKNTNGYYVKARITYRKMKVFKNIPFYKVAKERKQLISEGFDSFSINGNIGVLNSSNVEILHVKEYYKK